MKCSEVREELAAWLDKELPEETASQIGGHITLCAGCAQELASLKRTIAIVDSWKINSPEIDTYERIQSKLSAEPRKPVILRISIASAAAALVAFVLIKTIAPYQELNTTPEVRRDNEKEMADWARKVSEDPKNEITTSNAGKGPMDLKFDSTPSLGKGDTMGLLAFYKPPTRDFGMGDKQQSTENDDNSKDKEKARSKLNEELERAESNLFRFYGFNTEDENLAYVKKVGNEPMSKIKDFLSTAELGKKDEKGFKNYRDKVGPKDYAKKEFRNRDFYVTSKIIGEMLQLDINMPTGFVSVFIRKGQKVEPTSTTIARDDKLYKIKTYTNKHCMMVTIVSDEVDWEIIDILMDIF